MIPSAVLANITEIIGWSGRLWSIKNPSNFLSSDSLGAKQTPRYFFRVYTNTLLLHCIFPHPHFGQDIVSLVVQAAGGGMASTAVYNSESPDTTNSPRL